jgi:hypothetical protein
MALNLLAPDGYHAIRFAKAFDDIGTNRARRCDRVMLSQSDTWISDGRSDAAIA